MDVDDSPRGADPDVSFQEDVDVGGAAEDAEPLTPAPEDLTVRRQPEPEQEHEDEEELDETAEFEVEDNGDNSLDVSMSGPLDLSI